MTVPVLLVLAVVLAVWVRGRLVASERSRVELEAFRASLDLPPDRCQIIDVGPAQSWRTRRTIPAFATVHGSARPARAPRPVEVQR